MRPPGTTSKTAIPQQLPQYAPSDRLQRAAHRTDFCFVAARSMQVTKALPPARYVIGLGQVGARRRALITHDRKSVELVLLVLDALRDVVILGYCFGPRVLG